MLEVKALKFSFGTQPLFEGVSFDAAPGSSIAVLGRSGVGKSTLLRVIAGLLQPTTGRVSLDGADFIRDGRFVGDVAAFRRRVVLVPQEGGLWGTMSGAANIALPLQALKSMSASDALARTYDLAQIVSIDRKTLDRPPSELSGGQRQKVALLRAMALDASWVLLDEPTANLDPVSSLELAQLVALNCERAMGAIIVTHDMGFAMNAAQNYHFLSNGNLISSGSTATLDKDPTAEVRDFMRGSGRNV